MSGLLALFVEVWTQFFEDLFVMDFCLLVHNVNRWVLLFPFLFDRDYVLFLSCAMLF